MKNTCTIITTHKFKFKYALKFLETFYKHVNQPHKIYIIFSNIFEANEFRFLTNFDYETIILPADFELYKSIVNVKKYFALNSIIEQYDYIGVYDCETEIVKDVNLNEIYENIFNTKILKCNISEKGSEIIGNCAKKLGLFENKIIQNIVNKKLYWWFNEIPVYESKSFIRFYKWFEKLDNLDDIRNDYWCFDYIIYGIWLLVYEGFEIKEFDVDFYWGVVEEFRMSESDKNTFTELFDSYWETNSINHAKYEKIKMLFHTDVNPVIYE
jgi:hypothetical protein